MLLLHVIDNPPLPSLISKYLGKYLDSKKKKRKFYLPNTFTSNSLRCIINTIPLKYDLRSLNGTESTLSKR